MPQPTPPLIQQAFGANAAPGFIQNPIPVTTPDPGRASFNLGFPPQTMTEIFAGGTPPFGQDVNGILFMATSHIAALQAGQPYLFSATLAAAMSPPGYAVGTVLGMADGTGLWINTAAGNMTDPDGGSAAGWMPLYSRGFTTVSGLTGGTVALTPAQYRRDVIVLAGALAGNLQIILPSGTIGQRAWLIVNTTSGAFTTTVRTSGGTGVVVPQGGFSAPVEVYGDGVNIYPTVAPVNLPIDQNPTPSTIAQRTNNGYLFATYFNQNSALENFAMSGGIYADAGDGYHRKISIANFAAQIALSQFAGQVVAAQVPQSAVTQYAAAILTNAALTGTPTATTAALGDASTRVATTAFANPASVPGVSGRVQFPGGIILQWGTSGSIGGGGGTQFQAFSQAFPNACFGAYITARNGGGAAQATDFVSSIATNGFTIQNSGSVARTYNWFAVGN